MTNNQIKRILSGLGMSTSSDEILTIPYFRTIICETRRGIDGESDQLKFNYSKSLVKIKDYYHTPVLSQLYPYEVSGNSIKFISSSRRVSTDDVIVIADYQDKSLTKVGKVVSNNNSVITLDHTLTFNKYTQKMYFVNESVYNSSVPSPRNPLILLKYEAVSSNNVDTYLDINSIVAIDTFNASIDTSNA